MKRKILRSLLMALAVIVLLAATIAAQAPQTATDKITGTPTVTTEKMSGEVVKVEGTTLVVKMANGSLRTFNNIPASKKAVVDGQEVGLPDLKPGTKLTATVTKTTTPVTVRTTTVGTGRVFYVAGNNVILTLPSGENRQYQVKSDYKFMVNGQPATVFDLRPGMTVSAEKIVEEPTVEIATNSTIVGRTPSAPAAPAAAQAPGQPPAKAVAPAPAQLPSAPPARLPKTGGPVPIGGLLGLLFVGASFAIRLARRT